MVSERKDVFIFSIYKPLKHMTPRGAPFIAPGHNLIKRGRGPLDNVTCMSNIKALWLVVLDKKIVSCFHI